MGTLSSLIDGDAGRGCFFLSKFGLLEERLGVLMVVRDASRSDCAEA